MEERPQTVNLYCLNEYNQLQLMEAPTSCFLLATTRRRLQPLSLFQHQLNGRYNFVIFFWLQLEGGCNFLSVPAPNGRKLQLLCFSGTNLEMATTTCLVPPCHPVMKINSGSAFVCNVFTHYHLSAFHFCSFTVTALFLFSLYNSSP